MGLYPGMEAATDEAARRLKELLELAVQRAQAYLEDQSARGLLVRRTAAQMQDIVAELGLEEIAEELRMSFQHIAAVLADELEARGISAAVSSTSIEALQAFADDAIGKLFEQLGSELPAALAEIVQIGATTAMPLDDLVVELSQQMQTSVAHAVFEADTRLMAFDRLVLQEQGTAAGFELWLYDGPLPDGIIRPFCAAHAGKVYTLAELDALDNGSNQPKPVRIYLGGYNCRHYLTPVTPEEARAFRRT